MDPCQGRGGRGKYKMIIKEFRIAHTAEYPIYTMNHLSRSFERYCIILMALIKKGGMFFPSWYCNCNQ
jgi:hypothetical protein